MTAIATVRLWHPGMGQEIIVNEGDAAAWLAKGCQTLDAPRDLVADNPTPNDPPADNTPPAIVPPAVVPTTDVKPDEPKPDDVKPDVVPDTAPKGKK